MEEYLTVEETARALRVSVDTVRRWLRAGRLRGTKFGQVYRIPASALADGVRAGGSPRTAARRTPTETQTDRAAPPAPSAPRQDGLLDVARYRKRAAAALELIDRLAPLIGRNAAQLDIAAELEAMREERLREIWGE